MNNAQRKRLSAAVAQLQDLTDEDTLKGMKLEDIDKVLGFAESTVGEIAEEEREKFDNMNEGLQGSPTGQKIEENADALEQIDFDIVPTADDCKEEDWAENFVETVQGLIDEIEEFT